MGQHGIDSNRKFRGCGLWSSAACFRNAEDTPFFGFPSDLHRWVGGGLRRVSQCCASNLRHSENRFPQPAPRLVDAYQAILRPFYGFAFRKGAAGDLESDSDELDPKRFSVCDGPHQLPVIRLSDWSSRLPQQGCGHRRCCPNFNKVRSDLTLSLLIKSRAYTGATA